MHTMPGSIEKSGQFLPVLQAASYTSRQKSAKMWDDVFNKAIDAPKPLFVVHSVQVKSLKSFEIQRPKPGHINAIYTLNTIFTPNVAQIRPVCQDLVIINLYSACRRPSHASRGAVPAVTTFRLQYTYRNVLNTQSAVRLSDAPVHVQLGDSIGSWFICGLVNITRMRLISRRNKAHSPTSKSTRPGAASRLCLSRMGACRTMAAR